MSRISNLIEDHIMQIILESQGKAQISRNEIATEYNCAPSQINYVLTTRFTTDRGFVIESRRGGGGYIKITRLVTDKEEYLCNLLNKRIGDSVNKEGAFELLEILCKEGYIDEHVKVIIKASTDESTLGIIPKSIRDILRAQILKAAVTAALL